MKKDMIIVVRNEKFCILDRTTNINQTSFNVGNGGTYDAVSVANIDSKSYEGGEL